MTTGGEPAHHCHVEEGQLLNESIPLEWKKSSGEWEYSTCTKYVNFTVGNATQPCDDGWDYADEYKETIITEVG